MFIIKLIKLICVKDYNDNYRKQRKICIILHLCTVTNE